jgi:hypothetical protein
MIKPSRVLEIGTFTGFSALCLAKGLAQDGVFNFFLTQHDSRMTENTNSERHSVLAYNSMKLLNNFCAVGSWFSLFAAYFFAKPVKQNIFDL